VLSPEPRLGGPQTTETIVYRTRIRVCLCTGSSSCDQLGS
jgi:hypothetical protein